MLGIWSLVPLLFLNPVCTSGSSQFTYCWSLAWRILRITLLACEMCATVKQFKHSLAMHFFGNENWPFLVLWPESYLIFFLFFFILADNHKMATHSSRLAWKISLIIHEVVIELDTTERLNNNRNHMFSKRSLHIFVGFGSYDNLIFKTYSELFGLLILSGASRVPSAICWCCLNKQRNFLMLGSLVLQTRQDQEIPWSLS